MTSLPISLPKGFTPQVQVGSEVTVGTLLAKRIQVVEYILDLPHILRITKRNSSLFIKPEGEIVPKGGIIAQKKGFFSSKRIIAQRDCKILRLEESGRMILTTSDLNDSTDATIQEGEVQIDANGSRVVQQLLSPLDGTVTICNNEQIVIKTDKNCIVGIMATGGNVQGQLHLIKQDSSQDVITADMIGSVILGKTFSRAMLQKAIGMEVMGIIGTHIEEDDLSYFTKKKIDTPIIHIPDTVYPSLALWSGKTVYLDGPTHTVMLLSL